MEVSSPFDFILYCLMQVPIFLALGVLGWKLSPANMGLLSQTASWSVYVSLAGLYAYQVYHITKINGRVFHRETPEIERYSFKQVAVLDLTYMVTFGSELAVISMLPLFLMDTYGLSLTMAGLLAASFAFTNFVARPGGGWFSDRYGRKKSLLILLTGLIAGYVAMSTINASIPLPLAILFIVVCSIFVNAGNGAVYAAVPLIKRRMTGQIAGMVGAYGNVGGVVFLTVLSFVSPAIFFLTIAGAAIVTLLAVLFFLDEPSGQMAEVLPDGTVEMIDVS